MVTGELRSKVDSLWEIFWTGGLTNLLDVVEQMTYMLRRKSRQAEVSFRELKIYYAEKGYHLDEKSFEANLNLKNDKGEYNLL